MHGIAADLPAVPSLSPSGDGSPNSNKDVTCRWMSRLVGHSLIVEDESIRFLPRLGFGYLSLQHEHNPVDRAS
jgi:hypothetical protein